ncbi:MAG: hypothetical protein R8G33_07065 [Gammaproteobacteria bacterium]|nr:hypothetical protein [Gammaproteobacteria bacterium]
MISKITTRVLFVMLFPHCLQGATISQTEFLGASFTLTYDFTPIDDEPSPVPLPAIVWLLTSALFALGILGRPNK